MRLFIFAPLAVVLGLTFAAAAGMELSGGVNQEGADYDLTCTRGATVAWSDTWHDSADDVPGQFYKTDAIVQTQPVGTAQHPSPCMGLACKIVRTDAHHNQIGDIGEGRIDHTGACVGPGGGPIIFAQPVPVKDVMDVHVLIYNPHP